MTNTLNNFPALQASLAGLGFIEGGKNANVLNTQYNQVTRVVLGSMRLEVKPRRWLTVYLVEERLAGRELFDVFCIDETEPAAPFLESRHTIVPYGKLSVAAIEVVVKMLSN